MRSLVLSVLLLSLLAATFAAEPQFNVTLLKSLKGAALAVLDRVKKKNLVTASRLLASVALAHLCSLSLSLPPLLFSAEQIQGTLYTVVRCIRTWRALIANKRSSTVIRRNRVSISCPISV